jgi:hypothetical protein
MNGQYLCNRQITVSYVKGSAMVLQQVRLLSCRLDIWTGSCKPLDATLQVGHLGCAVITQKKRRKKINDIF